MSTYARPNLGKWQLMLVRTWEFETYECWSKPEKCQRMLVQTREMSTYVSPNHRNVNICWYKPEKCQRKLVQTWEMSAQTWEIPMYVGPNLRNINVQVLYVSPNLRNVKLHMLVQHKPKKCSLMLVQTWEMTWQCWISCHVWWLPVGQ